jgi:hypothetical protein
MRKLFESVKIALFLILGFAFFLTLLVPKVAGGLSILLWLILKTFTEPIIYIFALDILLAITLYSLFTNVKFKKGAKEFSKQFFGNM